MTFSEKSYLLSVDPFDQLSNHDTEFIRVYFKNFNTLFRKETRDHAGSRAQLDERKSLENFSVAVYFGRHGDHLEKSSCEIMDTGMHILGRDEFNEKRWRGYQRLCSSCLSGR